MGLPQRRSRSIRSLGLIELYIDCTLGNRNGPAGSKDRVLAKAMNEALDQEESCSRCCQSNLHSSPIGRHRSLSGAVYLASPRHSARAAERRSL